MVVIHGSHCTPDRVVNFMKKPVESGREHVQCAQVSFILYGIFKGYISSLSSPWMGSISLHCKGLRCFAKVCLERGDFK